MDNFYFTLFIIQCLFFLKLTCHCKVFFRAEKQTTKINLKLSYDGLYTRTSCNIIKRKRGYSLKYLFEE